jgi:hypothetical protein
VVRPGEGHISILLEVPHVATTITTQLR